MTLIKSLTVTCESAPVQAVGELADGRSFYFRARHRHITFTIHTGAVDDDPVYGAVTLEFQVTAHDDYFPRGDTRSDPHIVSHFDQERLLPLCELMADILTRHERYARDRRDD